jgi:hypothetical protein
MYPIMKKALSLFIEFPADTTFKAQKLVGTLYTAYSAWAVII